MDSRKYKPKNFGFTRPVKGDRSPKIYPDDEENDVISLRSPVQNSPVNLVS